MRRTPSLSITAMMFALFAVNLPSNVVAQDCKRCTCFLGIFCGVGQVTMPKRCIRHDGKRRCWHIHEPKGLGGARVPLVVDMHGFSVPVYTNLYSRIAHGRGHYDISGWRQKARSKQFIVVYPVGLGLLPAWNAGSSSPRGANEDDSAFIRKLINNMKNGFNVDPNRVYLTGHSNGCALAQRVQIENSDLVAGTACMALYRQQGYPVNNNYQPRSILTIHGTNDPVIPYNNYGPWPHGAKQNNAAWGDLHKCTFSSTSKPREYGIYSEYRNNCEGGATNELLTLPGVDHWPYRGKGTQFDTTEYAWNFLKDLNLASYTNGPPTPSPRGPCEDMARPLDGQETTCQEFKAYYGLGPADRCDIDRIRAHPNCQADDGCMANPGFIQTVCPGSCYASLAKGNCENENKCNDLEFPLRNLPGVPPGNHEHWSCFDYKANYGLGPTDRCDVDRIRAHRNCQANDDCMANPEFIQTRCPSSCRSESDCDLQKSSKCTDAEFNTIISMYFDELLVKCPKSCSQRPLSFPDSALKNHLPMCPNDNHTEWIANSCRSMECTDYINSPVFKSKVVPLLNKCWVGAGDGLKQVLEQECKTDIKCSVMEHEELMAEKHALLEACPKHCTHDPDELRLGYPACNEGGDEWKSESCAIPECAHYANTDDFLLRVVPLANKCYPNMGNSLNSLLKSTCKINERTECKDRERPLSGLGLPDGEYVRWTCDKYKGFYGLGQWDDCDSDKIKAHKNCDEGCQRDPSFIKTRCPKACKVCGDTSNPSPKPAPAPKPKDKLCNTEYSPVCSRDQKTYSNECLARKNSITSWTQGACFCDVPKNFLNKRCDKSKYCKKNQTPLKNKCCHKDCQKRYQFKRNLCTKKWINKCKHCKYTDC